MDRYTKSHYYCIVWEGNEFSDRVIKHHRPVEELELKVSDREADRSEFDIVYSRQQAFSATHVESGGHKMRQFVSSEVYGMKLDRLIVATHQEPQRISPSDGLPEWQRYERDTQAVLCSSVCPGGAEPFVSLRPQA